MGSFNTVLGTGGLVIPGGPVIFRAGVTLRSWTITFAPGATGSFTIPSSIREIGTVENPMSIDSLGGGGVGGGWMGFLSAFGGSVEAGGGGGSGSRGMGTFSLNRAILTGDIPFTTSVGADIGINNMRSVGSGGTAVGGIANTNSFVGTGRQNPTGAFVTHQAQSGDNGNATIISLAGTQIWSAGGGGGGNGGIYFSDNIFGGTISGGPGGATGIFTNGANAAGVTRITDTSVNGVMGGMGGPSLAGPPNPNDPGEPAIAPGQTTANDPGGGGIGSTISTIGSEPITQAGSARGGQVIVTFMARDTLVAGDISLSGGTLS